MRNERVPSKSRVFKEGDLVVGMRGGKRDSFVLGTYVESYCTLNNGYRNYARRIKRLRDGKVVSFQHLWSVPSQERREELEKMERDWRERFDSMMEMRRKEIEAFAKGRC